MAKQKQRRLAAYVHVHDLENGTTEIYGPDDDVPADVAEKITNPYAWEGSSPDKVTSPLDAGDGEVTAFVHDSTVTKVLEAVRAYDTDQRAEVAQHVLDIENDRDKGPRKSLVEELEAIAGSGG